MMKELHSRLSRILEKAGEMHRQLSLSRAETELLRRDVRQLKETIELQKNTIRHLEEKNKIVKIAEAVALSKEDKRLVKLKINEFIREIDKCVAALSD
jgi:hypothetical protein